MLAASERHGSVSPIFACQSRTHQLTVQPIAAAWRRVTTGTSSQWAAKHLASAGAALRIKDAVNVPQTIQNRVQVRQVRQLKREAGRGNLLARRRH